MTLFFVRAGFFMLSFLDRKGARRYLKDRFRRFGVPILLFLILIFPLFTYAYYVNFRPYGPIGFWDYYIHAYWGIDTQSPKNWTGPAWPDPHPVLPSFIPIP